MQKPNILVRKPPHFCPIRVYGLTPARLRGGRFNQLPVDSKKRITIKKKRDNPHSNRFIVVGTKALRRELMSGETLRAPRQQLRRLRASAFDLFLEHYQGRAS